jgi:hypothetical protein
VALVVCSCKIADFSPERNPVVRYRHRQFGATIILTVGVAAVLCFLLANRLPAGYISLTVSVILLICAILFSSLSIEVTETHLRWKFGPGLIHKRLLLSDIDHAEVTRTRWIEGWGIHFTSRGWLYNVSGFGAVAIKLKTGKQILLGTDDPQRLASVLQEHVHDRSDA